MKINIRKFLSALFCLLVLLSVYSCTYSVKDPGPKDNPTAADDYAPISQLSKSLLPEARQDLSKAQVLNSLAELSLPEFGDGVLRIAAYDPSYIFSSGSTDPLHAAVNERNELAEKKLKAIISEVRIPQAEFYDTVYAEYMAGNDICDIIIVPYSLMAPFVSAGMFMNVKSLPYVDYSKPYYDQEAMNSVTAGRMIYGVIGDYTYSPEKYWSVFYNRSLMNSLSLRDPLELVEQNCWTWDALMMYAKIASAKGYTPILSAEDDAAFCDAVWASSGIKTMDNDAPRAPQMNFNTKKSRDLMSLITSIIDSDKMFVSEKDSGEGSSLEIFSQGKTLFCFSKVSAISRLYDSSFGTGAVPLPSYDTEYTSYNSYVDPSAQAVFVLNNAPDTDLSGAAIQALSAASYGKNAKAFSELCTYYYLSDERSAAMIEKITNKGYYDLGFMLGPSVPEIASASYEMIHNTVFYKIDFATMYKQSIVAFNERYSQRKLFVLLS